MADQRKVFIFNGEATVSVTCRVEANSEQEAREMLEDGDCEWECDQVDGDVSRVELIHEEDC